jgi:hypothetical protein
MNPLMLLFVCEGGFRNLAFLGCDTTGSETSRASFIHMYLNVLEDLDHIVQLIKGVIDRLRANPAEEGTDDGNGAIERVSEESKHSKLHKRTIYIFEDLCILVSLLLSIYHVQFCQSLDI